MYLPHMQMPTTFEHTKILPTTFDKNPIINHNAGHGCFLVPCARRGCHIYTLPRYSRVVKTPLDTTAHFRSHTAQPCRCGMGVGFVELELPWPWGPLANLSLIFAMDSGAHAHHHARAVKRPTFRNWLEKAAARFPHLAGQTHAAHRPPRALVPGRWHHAPPITPRCRTSGPAHNPPRCAAWAWEFTPLCAGAGQEGARPGRTGPSHCHLTHISTFDDISESLVNIRTTATSCTQLVAPVVAEQATANTSKY